MLRLGGSELDGARTPLEREAMRSRSADRGGWGCVVEGDVGDAGLLVHLGARGGSVLEKDMVKLGANDVPCIVSRAEGNKIRIWK